MNPQPTCPSPVAVPCENGVLLMIEPPPGWVMGPASPPCRLALLDPQWPGPGWPNINVVVQGLGNMTPEEYLTLSRLQMKGMGDNVVVERDQPLGTPGGHVFEMQVQVGQALIRCRQLIVQHDSYAYVVTAMAPADRFEAYRACFERSLGSVSLTIRKGVDGAAVGCRPPAT